ncbi:unnamed protein product [Rotaria socialis]|uniref:Uncharacterized protein n=2 Tax=Rotaria socialis TaxID=392032 RepID=A0A820WZ81_9BILA|nr:unnamed protein product [Rotaria socialis]CAF4523503.1 unnamed protein product [Rotaria socialis]
MLSSKFNTSHRSIIKRQLLKINLGGLEKNPQISGTNNKVSYGDGASREQQTTLLRKAGDQAGRILEGGTDVVIAPAKWLAHMQENWLTYIVCATILMVGILFIYCCIRRKISSLLMPSPAGSTLSKMIRDEAIKIATFHRGIQNI